MLESLIIMDNIITVRKAVKRNLCVVAFLLLYMQYAGFSYDVKGITKPQRDVFLAFTTSGKIAEINFKEGESVAKGDVIATLEMQPEIIRLEQLKLEADNESEIEANQLELRQKEYDLSRMINAHIEGAAADSELDTARLAVDISRLRLKQSEHQKKLTELRYNELKAEIERRKLISPIDGIIEILEIDPGESVEALRPVVRIVVQDRLWVDLMVPLQLLSAIKSMDEIPVKFPGYNSNAGETTVNGRIEYIAAMADSASETVKIRVGIDNPRMLPIGIPVTVDLPDNDMNNNSEKSKRFSSSGKKVSSLEVSDKLFTPILQK